MKFWFSAHTAFGYCAVKCVIFTSQACDKWWVLKLQLCTGEKVIWIYSDMWSTVWYKIFTIGKF